MNNAASQIEIPGKAVYGVPAFVVACLFAYAIYGQGESVLAWAAVVPFLVAVSAWTGNRLFAFAIPIVLLVQVEIWQPTYFDRFTYTVFGVACMLVLALSFRLLTVAHSVFPRGTVRKHLTVVWEQSEHDKRSPQSFHWFELVPFLLLPIVWLLSGMLMDRVSGFDDRVSRSEFGLLPETYFLFRLAVVLTVLILVLRSGLAYARSFFAPAKLSGIDLRHEIWSWNGREQRLVGKQVRKARMWNRSNLGDERKPDV